MAELTHLIADYKNAALRPGGPGGLGTPQMNSLTRNGSRRSLVRAAPGAPSTLPHAHVPLAAQAPHAHHTTGHNTLTSHNSHATTATLTLSSHASSFAHGQPDLLKATPDHRADRDKKRTRAHDTAAA